MLNKVLVPDMGDFESVEIIEILVKTGDKIKKNDSIVTLESDKSSVEVPSTVEGTVENVNIKIGDKVSKGDLLITLKATVQSEENSKENLTAYEIFQCLQSSKSILFLFSYPISSLSTNSISFFIF